MAPSIEKWFSQSIVFRRNESKIAGAMDVNMYSCNSEQWGRANYRNVSNFRKKHTLDKGRLIHSIVSREDAVNEIGKNLTLVQGWGEEMASLFLKEASEDEIEGPHVVILPCPSSLEFAGLSPYSAGRDFGIEGCFMNSYSKHLGYHIGVSFAREIASFLDDFVTVILPHGFLVPKQKPTHYGYTYKTRDYLLHNPSDEALSSICTAKNIHIIDDNMVYGSTQARMIVGTFLACEEVGNFDAKLHSHTWFSRMMNTRVGSTTKDIILEATQNIDFVKRSRPHIPNSLEGRPLFQDSSGVFGMHWSGKIVHESESFWSADPYSFAIEAPKKPFFGIDKVYPYLDEELVASTPDEETSLWILRTKRGREELQRILNKCVSCVYQAFEVSLADGLLMEKTAFFSLFATHDQKEGMLAFIEKRNPKLGGSIRQRMFRFEDLIRLSAGDISKITKEVDQDDLIIALKNASAELKKAIYSTMSKRAVEALEEQLSFLGPKRLSEIEAAQDRVIQIVRELEEDEEIILDTGGSDVVVQ